MDVFETVDRIEETLEKSKRIPFSSNLIVNEGEIYDLLDELRNTLPEELKQSRWIVKERENMIEEAKRYSEKLVKDAKEKAEMLVSETEILKNATRKAEELMSAVEARARTIRLEAEDYADEKLANLEAVLHKLLTAIEKGREQFRGGINTGSGSGEK
jgi:cell division septum initiation protein DivIVA